MSNQKQYFIIKLVVEAFIVATAIILSQKTEAQIVSQTVTNKHIRQFSFSLGRIMRNEKNKDENVKNEANSEEAEPLDFSSHGRSGQQTAGESRGSCLTADRSLTAIAPKNNESQTITSHPQWWFYLPIAKSKIKKVEFVLQDENRTDIVREYIAISPTYPYLKATISPTHSGIESYRWYRWYLKVYCQETRASVPLFVSGWVRRVTPNSTINHLAQNRSLAPQDYMQAELWLDAIDLVISNLVSGYNTNLFARSWENILKSPRIDLDLPRPGVADVVTN